MEIITTEEVMDKLYMFQARFGQIDKFGWWYLDFFQQIQVHSLPPMSYKTNIKPAMFGLHKQL